MRGLGALALLAACGADAGSPRDRIRAQVRGLCGDAYRVTDEVRDGPVEVHACERDGVMVNAALSEHDATIAIRVELSGPSDDVARMRRDALAVIAPALDRDQRDAAETLLSRTLRSDGVAKQGTWLRNVQLGVQTVIDFAEPWRRKVEVWAIRLDDAQGAIQPVPDLPPATERTSPIAPLDLRAHGTWKAKCIDDDTLSDKLGFRITSTPGARWIVGDRWWRCRAVHLDIVATWDPDTSSLLYAALSIEASAEAFAATVAHFFDPVLPPAVRACVQRAARADAQREPCDGVFVTARHVGDNHELEIVDDPG